MTRGSYVVRRNRQSGDGGGTGKVIRVEEGLAEKFNSIADMRIYLFPARGS